MLIKAKDLQVGDVIAGHEVYSVQSAILFTLVCMEKEGKHYAPEFLNEMEINVERPEYVKVNKELVRRAIDCLGGSRCSSDAEELEKLL
jgi:hypothetical protein